jgi:hypothetical protein
MPGKSPRETIAAATARGLAVAAANRAIKVAAEDTSKSVPDAIAGIATDHGEEAAAIAAAAMATAVLNAIETACPRAEFRVSGL